MTSISILTCVLILNIYVFYPGLNSGFFSLFDLLVFLLFSCFNCVYFGQKFPCIMRFSLLVAISVYCMYVIPSPCILFCRSSSVGYNRYILVGYTCYIHLGYNCHILVIKTHPPPLPPMLRRTFNFISLKFKKKSTWQYPWIWFN